MSETRYYTVTQEREVKVWATNPTDAVLVAQEAFSNRQRSETVKGEVRSPVRERDISAREDY